MRQTEIISIGIKTTPETKERLAELTEALAAELKTVRVTQTQAIEIAIGEALDRRRRKGGKTS